jgi:hypothetical protein
MASFDILTRIASQRLQTELNRQAIYSKPASIKKSEEDEELAKSKGEGSRGGKVIGHTKSGKPIYMHDNNHDSTSVGGIHSNRYKNWTKEDHLDGLIAHALKKNKTSIKDENKKYIIHGHNIDAHYYHAKKLGSIDPHKEAVERMNNEK